MELRSPYLQQEEVEEVVAGVAIAQATADPAVVDPAVQLLPGCPSRRCHSHQASRPHLGLEIACRSLQHHRPLHPSALPSFRPRSSPVPLLGLAQWQPHQHPLPTPLRHRSSSVWGPRAAHHDTSDQYLASHIGCMGVPSRMSCGSGDSRRRHG